MTRNGLVLATLLLAAGCSGGGVEEENPGSGGGSGGGNPTVWHQASVSHSDGGWISPPSLSIAEGQQGTFTLSLDEGHQLSRISGCGGSLDGLSYTTAAMTADCVVTAQFEMQLYQLRVEVQGQGTVTPEALVVNNGEQGRFGLSPAEHHQIAAASGCGGTLEGNEFVTAPATGDCTVSVQFEPIQYTVTTHSEGAGQLLPPQQWVSRGEQAEFTVVPESGHVLWSVDGCDGELQGNRYLTGPIAGPCQVQVNFVSNAENAIRREDHRLASDLELIDHAREHLFNSEAARQALVDSVLAGIERISWHPSHDAVSFTTYQPETAWTLLPANEDGKGNPAVGGLVMASQQPQQRMVAMAANLFSVSRSDQSDRLLRQLIHWLTDGADQTDGLSIITAQMPSNADSHYFPHNERIRQWLTEYYPDNHRINGANQCDYAALLTCIDSQQPDLIVLSDIDRDGLGHQGIAQALAQAREAGIPLLLSNYWRDASPMLAPLYQQMGLAVRSNYYSKLNANELEVATLLASDPINQHVGALLLGLRSGQFDTAVLAPCETNLLHCNGATFVSAFKGGADWFRGAAVALDQQGLSAFELERADTLKAGLLLADKYRAAIDYPIEWQAPGEWQQAMFGDWVINYARARNLAQPDLGEYVLEESQVVKGEVAHYAYPDTTSQRQTITVPYRKQWTTTGWYALPGQTITLTRHDSSDAQVKVKLNYHRPNTNRAHASKVLRGPLELATQRLSVAAGQSVSFSSPYGGPIYLYINGSDGALSTDITASGIVHHPAILDFSQPEQIRTFNQRYAETELPHIDLRSPAAEQHLRRDRFDGAIGGATPDITALLNSVVNDHINPVYTLAGFKLAGQSLRESLPAEVATACSALLGQDCFDDSLHVRTIIQHSNYDQRAHCGHMCAGNPWDSAEKIDPIGWGDNHELGHNLQVGRLNVHYSDNADNWTRYSNRAGENSNNIFPYYIIWRAHYLRDGNTGPLFDRHMNHKTLFFAFMSDVNGAVNQAGERVVLKEDCTLLDSGEDRYEAPWASDKYAVHNGYRMAFYIQMALRAHGLTLADGTVLSNGFNIFTLLYQHHRVFGRYAGNSSDWLANRQRLGFSQFPYDGNAVYGGGKVSEIPGNDFMLVSLSHLTGLDWRSHFDLMGLRYSSLAAAQASANASKGALSMGMFVLETDLPPANMSEGLTFLSLSTESQTTRWPRDNSSPVDCSRSQRDL
ncbi:ImpA family metalloprotease [Ferrimonas balearica]|uniref:ImpA family metalloprotease n=1 Tax=Ferrimonas balearica TaxID=44012 RepID=UPI001FEF9E6B|nr:ImpA family metalloprotease [Ferrimonas balearica]